MRLGRTSSLRDGQGHQHLRKGRNEAGFPQPRAHSPGTPRSGLAGVLEDAESTGDLDSIPRSGRFPGGENGNLLQYSCLENPTDRGAWQATVHGVTESDMTDPFHPFNLGGMDVCPEMGLKDTLES